MSNLYFNRKIGVSILRFLLGFLIFKDFIIYYINREYLFNKNGIISYNTYLDIAKYFKLNWLYIDFTKDYNIVLFCMLGIVFSFLFMIGIAQRLSAIILFFSLFILKARNLYILDGADNVISVILPFFLFIDTYSISNKYELAKEKLSPKILSISNMFSTYFSIAIMVQVCIIYFFAGLHKLQGEVWREGTALYYILNSQDFSPTRFNSYFTKSIILVKISTWFTIIFQLMFPFFLFFRKTKVIIIFIGMLLHFGIFFMMKIDNFSLIMISCYTVFFTDNEYRILFNKLNMKYAV